MPRVIAFILLFIVWVYSTALVWADESLEKGLQALKKGKYDLAIEIFNQVIQTSPQSAEAYANRGGAHLKRGEFDRAIADCDVALFLKPKFEEAFVNRGGAYLNKGNFEKAIADCNSAIQLNAHNAEAFGNRGTAYLVGKREYNKALADLLEANRLDPLSSEACNNLAILLAACPEAGIRDGKKAREHARRACELTQWKDAACLDTLAVAFAELGDFSQAVRWEKRAMEAGKNLPKTVMDELQAHLTLFEQKKGYRMR